MEGKTRIYFRSRYKFRSRSIKVLVKVWDYIFESKKVYFLGSVGSVLVLIGIILSVLHFTKEVTNKLIYYHVSNWRWASSLVPYLSMAILWRPLLNYWANILLITFLLQNFEIIFRIFWDMIKLRRSKWHLVN